MQLFRCVSALVVAASLIFQSSQAHSVQRNPLNYVTTIEEPIIHSPSHRVNSLSTFELTFHLHQQRQKIRLTLSPNHDVIAEGATVQYLAPDGSVRKTEVIDRTQHKVFMGQAWIQHKYHDEWTNVGWARITVYRDGDDPIFEGAFRVDGDHHHIQTRANYLQTRHEDDPFPDDDGESTMVVWRDTDVSFDKHTDLRRSLSADSSCSSDDLEFNMNVDHPIYGVMPTAPKKELGFWTSLSTRALFGRQIDNSTSGNSAGVNLTSTIGNSNGCPTARKVALVGIATDCTYTAAFNSSETARSNIINQMNSASVQYEDSFNITLGIQNLTISDASCPGTPPSTTPWNVPCTSTDTIQDRLNLFSGWRGQQNDNNAYWMLLSTCNTGSAVGLAWLGQACVNTATTSSSSSGNETVSGANVVVRTSTEWQVMAHEGGHIFGAVHDCDSQTCSDGVTVAAQQCCPLSATTCNANGQYIMNPSTGPGITKFSPCTVGNICSAIGRNSVKTTCLTSNRNVNTITGSQCGNGIVETGEDCDCGGTSGCGNNTCCDPTTCKFKTAAVCDPSNEECCTSSCQFASNGTICRASTGSCDPAETCSGTAASCPADQTAPDGTSCGNSSQSLSCASGQCTSRDLQCKTLMGSFTAGNTTYACSSSGCQISCASPEFGPNVCYQMQQNFLDGTTCGGDGKCNNGQCQGNTVGGEIKSWIDSNKPLVIGLAAGIGGFLLLAILSCIIACCRRRGRQKRVVNNVPPGWGPPGPRPRMPPQGQGQWNGPQGWNVPPPPPMRSRGAQGWGGPPPSYPGPGGGSVRYA